LGDFLRRCRGAFGIGMVWGAAWAAFLAAASVIIGIFDPDSIDPGEGPLMLARFGAAFGFVSGAAFGVLLSLTESRKGILKLSLPRAALWGVLGSAALPLLTPMNDSILVFACPLGAALAAGTVALARRAELRAGHEQSQLP
jgi:hypothetical protein